MSRQLSLISPRFPPGWNELDLNTQKMRLFDGPNYDSSPFAEYVITHTKKQLFEQNI